MIHLYHLYVKKVYFDKMMALSAANQVRVIDKDAFEYYDSWKNQVVRENVYEQTDKSVVGSKEGLTLAIRMMHREMGRLGIESIDQFSPENRNVTGVTLGVNREGYEEIVKELDICRKKIISIAAKCDKLDQVCRLNLQFFPLTQRVENGSEE